MKWMSWWVDSEGTPLICLKCIQTLHNDMLYITLNKFHNHHWIHIWSIIILQELVNSLKVWFHIKVLFRNVILTIVVYHQTQTWRKWNSKSVRLYSTCSLTVSVTSDVPLRTLSWTQSSGAGFVNTRICAIQNWEWLLISSSFPQFELRHHRMQTFYSNLNHQNYNQNGNLLF